MVEEPQGVHVLEDFGEARLAQAWGQHNKENSAFMPGRRLARGGATEEHEGAVARSQQVAKGALEVARGTCSRMARGKEGEPPSSC